MGAGGAGAGEDRRCFVVEGHFVSLLLKVSLFWRYINVVIGYMKPCISLLICNGLCFVDECSGRVDEMSSSGGGVEV